MQTNTYTPPVPGDETDFATLSTTRVNVGPVERVISGVAGGALLAYAALHRKALTDLPISLAGGYLVYRAVSGHCPINERIGRDTAHPKAVEMTETVTVNKPIDEVYQFWRELENLPLFMKHLDNVTQLDNRRSHWEAPVPGGLGTITWDATILEERENEYLSWQSDDDATVNNSGVVEFREAPGGRGTEVRATIKYLPPAGELGKGVASLLNPTFGRMVKEDLRRFKRYIETGEIPTIEGQPSGRSSDLSHRLREELI